MARSAASIQAEITTIEAYLAGADSLVSAVASRGTSVTNASRKDLTDRVDQLYMQLGRVDGTSPMFARGNVTGLRGS